jgi:hypothetical protein
MTKYIIGTIAILGFATLAFSQSIQSRGPMYDVEVATNISKEVDEKAFNSYVETALANGCRPIVDICTNNCKAVLKLNEQGIKSDCATTHIIRMNFKEAHDRYYALAEKHGMKDLNPNKMPEFIRSKLVEKGQAVSALKENLAVPIKRIKEQVDVPITSEIEQ